MNTCNFSMKEAKLKSSFVNSKNDLKSVKSAMSCIRFLLVNAARFQTDESTFSTELQQLGVPAEHSNAICRVYSEHASNVKGYLTKNSLTGKWVRFDICFECKSQQFLGYLVLER